MTLYSLFLCVARRLKSLKVLCTNIDWVMTTILLSVDDDEVHFVSLQVLMWWVPILLQVDESNARPATWMLVSLECPFCALPIYVCVCVGNLCSCTYIVAHRIWGHCIISSPFCTYFLYNEKDVNVPCQCICVCVFINSLMYIIHFRSWSSLYWPVFLF